MVSYTKTSWANGTSPAINATNLNKIETGIKACADAINNLYPVGAIYMSVNNVSPSSFFGGTWVQLKDRFLLGAGDTYTAGNTGGSAALQAHSHTFLTADNQNQTSGWTDNGRILRTGSSYDIAKSTSTAGTGDSGNMPPYLVVYMWKRTA